MQGLNDPVKCECVGRLFAGRGLDVLALSIWLDSAGSSGVLLGVLGVTRRRMTERLIREPFLAAPPLEHQGVTERL